jgi:hypothetical protein
LRWPFYSIGGWESDCSERVTDGDGVDSILWFQLEKGDDGMKCCQKMKRRQRGHLGSMGMKHDVVQQRGDDGRRRGGTVEGKGRR